MGSLGMKEYFSPDHGRWTNWMTGGDLPKDTWLRSSRVRMNKHFLTNTSNTSTSKWKHGLKLSKMSILLAYSVLGYIYIYIISQLELMLQSRENCRRTANKYIW